MQMIAAYYGKYYSLETISKWIEFNKNGTSFKELSMAAKKMGFKVTGVKVTYDQLINHCRFPCILHWGKTHFVVMISYHNEKFREFFKIADPAIGLLGLNKERVTERWLSENEKSEGFVLLLEPGADFQVDIKEGL